jgi:hypothetical protein
MRTRGSLFCFAILGAVTLSRDTEAFAQIPTPQVTLLVRLIDDSTRRGVADRSFWLDSTAIRPTFVDSTHQYQLTYPLRAGRHRLVVRRVGYNVSSVEFTVTDERRLDLGTVVMQRSCCVHEDMVLPTCVRLRVPPRTLREGQWLQPAPDSAGRQTWYLCDGIRRARNRGAVVLRGRRLTDVAADATDSYGRLPFAARRQPSYLTRRS